MTYAAPGWRTATRAAWRAIVQRRLTTRLPLATAITPTGITQPREKCGLTRACQATTAVEFAICGLAMVLMIVGFAEFGRLAWSIEVLQEVATQGARCMGLGASSCSAAGVYSSTNTVSYVVSLAASRGVAITTAMVALSPTAVCGGASGFSQVSITYPFTTVAPALLTSLANGVTLPATACFPNHS